MTAFYADDPRPEPDYGAPCGCGCALADHNADGSCTCCGDCDGFQPATCDLCNQSPCCCDELTDPYRDRQMED